mgnify:FL=1
MNTYLLTNTEKWGLRHHEELSHPDYEHNITTTECYKFGQFEVTPRNAKEEEKLLNWVAKTDNDFILDDWDWEPVEFGEGDISADSEMDYDTLEGIEEETENGFWGLSQVWDYVDEEFIVVDGKIKITPPEGWEIVDV